MLEVDDPHQTVAEMYGREIEPVPVDGTTRVEVCFSYEDALCMSGPAPRPT